MNRRDDLTGELDVGFAAAAPPAAPAVVPVSALVTSARLVLERHLGLAWISGEISNFTRAASGHCYFNLKDAKAQVRCVFFRQKAQFIRFALKDGVQVELRAVPTIYEARGEFQLNVETMREAGVGRLYERFAELKARLAAAGWFDEAAKRPVPGHPGRVGVVTSLHAAALRDVLTTLRRRFRTLPVIVYPASVQGAGAAAEIAAAIRMANARAEVDVLIVCRGGGSIEDLWPFNEEIVARAIHESILPVVAGIGHETDFTIADFVADARAPTPTAAAILVSPDGAALLRAVALHRRRWLAGAHRDLEARMQRMDAAARRLVHPAARLVQQGRVLRDLGTRLARCHAQRMRAWDARLDGVQRGFRWRIARPLPQCAALVHARDAFLRLSRSRLDALGARVDALQQNLQHLDPSAVLERGYAIVATPAGRIVTAADEVAAGDDVELTFGRGKARAIIAGTQGSDGL